MAHQSQESGVGRSAGRVWLWPALEVVGVVVAVYLLVVWWGTGDWVRIGAAGFLAVSCTARLVLVLVLRRGRARKSATPGT